MSPFQENLFSLSYTIFYRNFRIFWKIFISDNKLMKLISKIICASCASVPIIDRKEGAPGPLLHLFEFRFDYVQNNGNSIFVVISNNSLMSICRIAAYDAVFFACKLGWMIRCDISIDLILFHFHIFLLLLLSHDKSSVGYQLVMTFRLLKRFLSLFLVLTWALPLYFMMTRGWRLRMTRFVSLGSVTLTLSYSRVCASALFLRVVLRVLVLRILSVLRSAGFVSHP